MGILRKGISMFDTVLLLEIFFSKMTVKLRLSSKSNWSKAVMGALLLPWFPVLAHTGQRCSFLWCHVISLKSCSICSPQCDQKAEVSKLKEEVFILAIFLRGFSP